MHVFSWSLLESDCYMQLRLLQSHRREHLRRPQQHERYLPEPAGRLRAHEVQLRAAWRPGVHGVLLLPKHSQAPSTASCPLPLVLWLALLHHVAHFWLPVWQYAAALWPPPFPSSPLIFIRIMI